ncbi:hypothetical protein TSST111916_20075 [Tsukamurella strandjordii]|uniref:hypothetical protein n=1 Tax=Tsukamurella TaxID=2060 RepID=UPI001C7D6443|nr:hypothetical protein [Tsukamurella sp. TY48]
MHRSTRFTATTALVAALLLTAACGGTGTTASPTVTVTTAPSGDPGGADPSTSPTVPVTANDTVAPTPLPPGPGGASRVLTASGKTTCNIRADLVECQSEEFGRSYRAKTGEPATGFVYRGGELGWYYGNMAVTAPATTLRYGSAYSAYGWVVTARPERTVFTRDGHGVSVDVANTTTF